MNPRAKRLILPLGGVLAASSLVSLTFITSPASASARDDVKTGNLSANSGDAKGIASQWNPAKLKLMQGGKVTGGTLFSGQSRTRIPS